jgi:hypothetical protein|tara:strand:+ start:6280 stop:6747 length:468 start_codon:yes stop_codon:yes gene_type:complete
MSTEISTNFIKQLEILQNVLIENNHQEGVCGDGKSLLSNEAYPITNNFSDGLYMRQMKMAADTIAISAIHHTNHFWFLLSGKVIVESNKETVEHIAPCWSHSIKGAKRLIRCIEDCVWINIIANPTNTNDMEEVEENFFSITLEEYNKKEKLWQD